MDHAPMTDGVCERKKCHKNRKSRVWLVHHSSDPGLQRLFLGYCHCDGDGDAEDGGLVRGNEADCGD